MLSSVTMNNEIHAFAILMCGGENPWKFLLSVPIPIGCGFDNNGWVDIGYHEECRVSCLELAKGIDQDAFDAHCWSYFVLDPLFALFVDHFLINFVRSCAP
jgi:hypothetical protein